MLPTVTQLGLGLSHALAPGSNPISPYPPAVPEPWTLSRLAGALRQRSVNLRLPQGSLKLFTVCRKNKLCTLRFVRAHVTVGSVAAEAEGHVTSHWAVRNARWQCRPRVRKTLEKETLEDGEMHFLLFRTARKSLLRAKPSARILRPPRCVSRRLWPRVASNSRRETAVPGLIHGCVCRKRRLQEMRLIG